jgi:hypothetical protein
MNELITQLMNPEYWTQTHPGPLSTKMEVISLIIIGLLYFFFFLVRHFEYTNARMRNVVYAHLWQYSTRFYFCFDTNQYHI